MAYDYADTENLDKSEDRNLLAALFVRMRYSPSEMEALIEERKVAIRCRLAKALGCSGPRPAMSPVNQARRKTCPYPP